MERFPGTQEVAENSFEEQFKNLQEVRLPSGTAEVADLTPENLKDEVPVFLAPAWGMGLPTYRPAMKELFDAGRHVVSLEHPRIGGAMDSSMNVGELTEKPPAGKKYSVAELRKALNILEVLEERNIEKVDAIAHSEGALNIAMAAAMYPEKFRSIAFFGPAGMLKDETWARLSVGFLKNMKGVRKTSPQSIEGIPFTETEREVGAAAGRDFLRYLKNPFRMVSEVAAIKKDHYRTKGLIPYLHDLGINVAVMSADGDPMFPQVDVEKAAEMDSVDAFIPVPGGHGMIGEHPEIVVPLANEFFQKYATHEKTPEQKEMLANREYQAGVRYVLGEGLVISEYVKKGKPREDSGV